MCKGTPTFYCLSCLKSYLSTLLCEGNGSRKCVRNNIPCQKSCLSVEEEVTGEVTSVCPELVLISLYVIVKKCQLRVESLGGRINQHSA